MSAARARRQGIEAPSPGPDRARPPDGGYGQIRSRTRIGQRPPRKRHRRSRPAYGGPGPAPTMRCNPRCVTALRARLEHELRQHLGRGARSESPPAGHSPRDPQSLVQPSAQTADPIPQPASLIPRPCNFRKGTVSAATAQQGAMMKTGKKSSDRACHGAKAPLLKGFRALHARTTERSLLCLSAAAGRRRAASSDISVPQALGRPGSVASDALRDTAADRSTATACRAWRSRAACTTR